MQEMRRIAIYSRKSKFTGKGESIENQIELCRRYIAVHYGEEAASSALVYEDEGFSGGNLERPQFKKMMADAEKDPFPAVVVYRLDRISRNIGDFAKLIEALTERNISFVSIREQFDTSSPMGRAMMYIASVFSQLERETIAERIRDNMHELAKTGRWLGGVTPTGYASEAVEKISVDGKLRKACRLRLVWEEAAVVKRIFAKFLQSGSLTETAACLLEEGAVSKNGKPFSRFAVKGILSNPVYGIADRDAFQYWTEKQADLFAAENDFSGAHGVIAYNRTMQKPGKAHQLKPVGEWIVAVGAHPGLISGRDWCRVQRLLEENSAPSYRKPRSNVALLPGILFCGSCGEPMRPKMSQRFAKDGQRRFSYLCSRKERSRGQRCKSNNIDGNLLDRVVLREIQALPRDDFLLRQYLEEGKERYAEGSLCGAKDKDIQGASAAGAELSTAEFAALGQRLTSFSAAIESLSVPQKREVIRALAAKVVWDGAAAHLYLFAAKAEEMCGLGASPTPLGEDSQ